TQDQRDVSRFLGIRSAAVAPLFWEGRLVGSITAGSERPRAFGAADAQLLMGIAGQVAYLAILPDRFDDLKRRVKALQADRREGVRLMAVVADAHAGFPSHDFVRLRDLAEKLALKLGQPPEQAEEIGLAAMLHDVGKYLVPARILSNPLQLSESEWETMRRHTVWGYELLSAHAGFALQAQAARWHHERWDGFGYPDGLVADEIPLPAAIAAVADAMDAMVYDRVYRGGMPAEAALAQVVAGAGSQFSPRVVDALVALYREGQISFLAPAREESRRAA
ncbi:MAG TPA: HD domain-containing phosphohydrolase, partial [Dehalococcoidia bacterium]|nr:HD domain-containing phosphohydrolase [Dehalococcoidia bacterium]